MSHYNIQFDTLFHAIEKPLPSSPMANPQHFLSVNEDAILHGLDESRREHRHITMTRLAASFGVLTAIAMLLTFSREVRAFARETLYSVIEWFSPHQNESGVTFDIEGSAHPGAPDTSVLKPDEKLSFDDLSEVDRFYSPSFYVLSSPSFSLTGGFIQNETICLNYLADGIKVQIIAEPIQSSGSVTFHFNDGSFSKLDVASLGTFYYDLSDGRLFGGMMANGTSLVISVPQNATPELLDQIAGSLSLYR